MRSKDSVKIFIERDAVVREESTARYSTTALRVYQITYCRILRRTVRSLTICLVR